MAALYRYAAFISYSSKDASFARRLHRALEGYRMPKALGTFDLIGGGKRNRIYPVCRDREELAAGVLSERIEAAFRSSAALIVVCSPHTVIPDTAPFTEKDGTDAASSCFPRALQHETALGRMQTRSPGTPA
jgi:hypothetical protein